MSNERRPGGPWRKLGRVLAGLVSAVALTELGAAAVWLVTARECFSFSRMEERQLDAIAQEDLTVVDRADPLDASPEVHHPFLGFLVDPGEGESGSSHPLPYTAELFGHYDNDPIRILVVGGSVAGQVTGELNDALLAQGFPAERLHVVGTAEGGYKEPQQLAVVTYLLALGATFDLVINIDGFNEAVLSVAENYGEGVYPHYPRSWNDRFLNLTDTRTARAVGLVAHWQQARGGAARAIAGSALAYSVTANVVWSSWDHHLSQELARSREALGQIEQERSYQTHGPRFEGTQDAAFRDAALVWARSSVAIHRLAQAYGFEYLHFLQPNQYLTGRKPLSEEEQARFVHTESSYGRVAARGYDELLGVAPVLEGAGVRYHDLTRLFEEDGRTLYADDCCHFNAIGRRALADRIAAVARPILLPDAGEP